MLSIPDRAEVNYEIPFDNDQWRFEQANVEAGEKALPPLTAQGAWQTASPRRLE